MDHHHHVPASPPYSPASDPDAAVSLSGEESVRFAEPEAPPPPPLRPLSVLIANSKNLANATKKRKVAPITVNLLSFVSILERAFKDSVLNGSKLIVPDNYTEYYMREKLMEEDGSSTGKRARISEHRNSVGTPPTAVTSQTDDDEALATVTKQQHKESLYLELLMYIIQDLDTRGAIFQFSREALKYFLATRSRFVSRSHFYDTNQLHKTEKLRGKSQQQLPAGAILLEYVKGTDTFVNALHRSCKEDIGALKKIIDSDIRIPINIYGIVRKVKCAQLQYREIPPNETLSLNEYVRIPIASSTFKRTQIVVTRYLVLLQDGNQFIINPTVEKDFTSVMMNSRERLPRTGYIVFDALVGVKSKIIDVVSLCLDDCVLPDVYLDRLAIVNARYPDLKTLKPCADSNNSNYLYKPMCGFGTAYIKLKPLLTAAIVGISERYACAALMTEDGECDELTIITKFGVSGPAACTIATAEFQDPPMPAKAVTPTIMVNGTKCKITGDLGDVSLFVDAVLVEIKDLHKFGGISDRPVSSRDEYRQVFHASKETKGNDAVLEMVNDPSRVEELAELLSGSPCFERLKTLMDCKMNFESVY